MSSTALSQVRYTVKFDSQLVELSRQIMLSYNGIRETHGNNRGRELDSLQKEFGIKLGSSYCAILQYLAYQFASEELDVKNPIRKTAVANQIFSQLQKISKKTGYVPQIDDFIFWKYANSWQGHIERIIEICKGGWVLTIAANVSLGKDVSNDGNGGVTFKNRNIWHPLTRTLRPRGLQGVNGI